MNAAIWNSLIPPAAGMGAAHVRRLVSELAAALEPYRESILSLYARLPSPVQHGIALSFLLAALGTVLAVGAAVWENRACGKKEGGRYLGFSFGSGQYRRGQTMRNALRRLTDPRWNPVSAFTAAYRLSIQSPDSSVLAFLLSIVFLGLVLPALAEMVFRYTICLAALFLLNLACMLFLAVLHLAGLVICALLRVLEKAGQHTQYCPRCYAAFSIASFQCRQENCGKKYSNLFPSRYGILFTRCGCGHLLPCSLFSGRNRLPAFCPNCGSPLPFSNARHVSILLIGGKQAGKSAYLAAFQHQYMAGVQLCVPSWEIDAWPPEAVSSLEQTYVTGAALPPSAQELAPFCFLHSRDKAVRCSLAVFDVSSHVLHSGVYKRNPLVFGYAGGAVILIDPLRLRTVQEECRAEGINPGFFSEDGTEEVVADFINTYTRISGQSYEKVHTFPVAVVIGKADIKTVKREIGYPKLKSLSRGENRDIREVRNQVCREYLENHGLAGMVRNLEAAFSQVQYFPASAMGHDSRTGGGFQPWGVLEPMEWIAASSMRSAKLFFPKQPQTGQNG